MRTAPKLDPNPAPQRATLRHLRRRRIRTIIFSAAILTTAATFISPRATAQDLGEIARQERAKKQNNPAPSTTHVYTNDDVKRAEILTPEDKSRFSATNQPSAQPAIVKPPQSTTQSASESAPGNADLPIGARPPILAESTKSDTTSLSTPTRNSIHSSAQSQTKQSPPQPNISPKPATRAKTNSTPGNADLLIGARTPIAAAQPVDAPIPVAAARAIATTTPTSISFDQMPLGDVARYYRAKKRALLPVEAAEASAKADAIAVPNSAPNLQSALITVTTVDAPAQPVATPVLTNTQLNQMPLGDVARYYRAKKLQDAAITITLSVAAPGPSTGPYPMTIFAAPLASMKSPPARKPEAKVTKPRVSAPPGNADPQPAILRSPTSTSPPRKSRTSLDKSRLLAAPTRSVAGPATSIRIARGDTLWQLARKYLSSGTRWTELLALNPTLQNPRRLQVGTQLVLHTST